MKEHLKYSNEIEKNQKLNFNDKLAMLFLYF